MSYVNIGGALVQSNIKVSVKRRNLSIATYLLTNAQSVFDVMQFDFFVYDQRNHLRVT